MKHIRFFAILLLLCLAVSPAGAGRYELDDGRYIILSLGGSFGYARDVNGVIYTWGDNQFGQLGRGYTNPELMMIKPAPLVSNNKYLDLTRVIDIFATTNYSYLLMDDLTLYGAGNNSYLPLACAERNYPTHVKVDLPEIPAAIATGFGQTLMLTENGEVYGWGRNNAGQVGNGKRKNQMKPVKLPLEHITQIACGGQFSLALDSQGRLWGWGSNEYHTLSPGNASAFTTPTLINTDNIEIAAMDGGGFTVALLDTQGRVWTWGRNDKYQLGYETHGKTTSKPGLVQLPLPARSIQVYNSQTYAILEDGTLWSWGNNGYGQLGQGKTRTKGQALPGLCAEGDIVIAETGSMFAMCVRKDGTVLCAGFNNHSELATGDMFHSNTMKPNLLDLIPD